jgi:ABC-type Fe3+-hydroxamate transport system substrate-binding protein
MNKKLMAFSLATLFAAGVSYAAPAKSSKTTASTKTTAAHTHKVSAEIVSTDAAAKTLTIKDATGEKTVPAEGKAVASLSTVKAGDKVTLTCRDNEAGEHQAVTSIMKAGAAKSKAKTKAKTS